MRKQLSKQPLTPDGSYVEYVQIPFAAVSDQIRFDYKDFVGITKIWQIGGGVCRFAVRPQENNSSSNHSTGSPMLQSVTSVIGSQNYVLDSVPAFSLALNVPLDFVHPLWTKTLFIQGTTISTCYIAWQYIISKPWK